MSETVVIGELCCAGYGSKQQKQVGVIKLMQSDNSLGQVLGRLANGVQPEHMKEFIIDNEMVKWH